MKYQVHQRIYKQYIGQYQDILKMKKWLLLFHHVVVNILAESKSEKYINEKLKLLKINMTYKKKSFIFQESKIETLETIYCDFITQFSAFEQDEYVSYTELENSKLILFNIIESYFNHINRITRSMRTKQFYRLSKNRMSCLIPRTKEGKILYRIIQNTIYYIIVISIFLFIAYLLFVPYAYVVIGVIDLYEYLPKPILWILGIFSQKTIVSIFNIIIFYFAGFGSLFTALYLYVKAKRIFQIFFPEKDICFPRDLSENQFFLSNMAIIISIVSIISTIILTLFITR